MELSWQASQGCQLELPFASSSAFQLLTDALGKQLAAHQAHRHALPLQGNHWLLLSFWECKRITHSMKHLSHSTYKLKRVASSIDVCTRGKRPITSVKGSLGQCAIRDTAANSLPGFAALDKHAYNVTGLTQADDGQITCPAQQ